MHNYMHKRIDACIYQHKMLYNALMIVIMYKTSYIVYNNVHLIQ